MLFEPSKEQQRVLDSINDNNNVIVDSVAGSGKTTTILHIANKFNTSNILLLTYNSKLRIETRDKAKKYNINNLNVFTYHSFCVKKYNEKCFRDGEIYNLLLTNTPPIENFNYDIIVLDEAQDINPLYYRLIKKIYRENYKDNIEISNNNKDIDNSYLYPAKICVLGDKYQSIYDFNGADNRFIRFSDKCYGFNHFEWSETPLTRSFRITQQMSDFINMCMLGEKRIISDKQGVKPEYIICNPTILYKMVNEKNPYDIIKDLIDNKGYKPGDIFVLSASVKAGKNNKSPLRKLENKLSIELKVPIYVPSSDEEKVDSSVIDNKLVISTFHQTKGLERKVVLILGFDSDYFRFYKKNKPTNICPNELYVATTRAQERLYLFQNCEKPPLPFLNMDLIEEYTDFYRMENFVPDENKENISMNVNINKRYDVSGLCNHLPHEVLRSCMDLIQTKTIYKFTLGENNEVLEESGEGGEGEAEETEEENYTIFDIPVKTKKKYETETVEIISDITGIAIPLYFEYSKTGTITFIDELVKYEKNNKQLKQNPNKNDKRDIKNIKNDIENKKLDIEELLYLSNKIQSKKSGYIYKLSQIKRYDWLNKEHLYKCMKNIEALKLTDDIKFEYGVNIRYIYNGYNFFISGYLDCIDCNNTRILEFKCVSGFEDSHIIQLVIYAFIIETNRRNTENGCKYEKQRIKNLRKTYLSSNEIDNMELDNNMFKMSDEGGENCKNKTLQYYLYNILKHEIIRLDIDYDKIKEIMNILLESKTSIKGEISDEEFIENLKYNY